MRHIFRRRRHTSNWVYTIVAVCILLVTLCIISLIPGGSSSGSTATTPSPGPSDGTAGSENSGQNSPGTSIGDGSAPNHETDGISPAAPYITITINKARLSALKEAYQTGGAAPTAQSLEQIRLQLQELILAKEQLTAEREEFQSFYETALEELNAEKNDYLQKQADLQTESERLKKELSETATQLSEYNDRLSALETNRQKLSEEEKELQQTEAQLQHLNEDITHAREQLTAERRELESGIQSIKENPNLSSENKETALMPLYAALEQLLMREAQLEHSEAEYEERSEALFAQKENLDTRLQNHEAERDKLDKLLAPHKQTQQQLTSALKMAEAQLLPIVPELERIETEESTLGKEYQDKRASLDAEEERITQEEQTLKRQAASLQTNSEQDIQDTSIQDVHVLAQRTLERILIILQDVSLSEGSNIASDILLTDVADIMISTPEPNVQHQGVSGTLPDSSEADNSGSHKRRN